MEKVIEAEFTDVDGTEKGGKRLLEEVADLADTISKPFDRLPGGQRAASRIRDAGVAVREVDGAIEEAKPVFKKIGARLKSAAEKLGLDEISDREVLSRR